MEPRNLERKLAEIVDAKAAEVTTRLASVFADHNGTRDRRGRRHPREPTESSKWKSRHQTLEQAIELIVEELLAM